MKIELTKGYVAIVDDVDYEYLMQWKWYASESRSGGRVYARRMIYKGGRKAIHMHREVLSRSLGRVLLPDENVDHIEGIGLDNQRHNLRLATRRENTRNQGLNIANTSGFKGVYLDQGKWRAQIYKDGKAVYLGVFSDLKEAAVAYDDAAKKLHGEFAKTNESLGLL